MINTNYTGNLQQPVQQTLGGTTTTKIGSTANDKTTTLAAFSFINATAGAVTCSLYWYDSATTTERLIWIGSVATNTTVTISDQPVKLIKTDEIRAKGAASVAVSLLYTQSVPNSQ